MPETGSPRECMTCHHLEGFHTYGSNGTCGSIGCKCRAFVDPPAADSRIGMNAVAWHSLVARPEPTPWYINISWNHYGIENYVLLDVEEAEGLLSSLIGAIEAAKKANGAS